MTVSALENVGVYDSSSCAMVQWSKLESPILSTIVSGLGLKVFDAYTEIAQWVNTAVSEVQNTDASLSEDQAVSVL
jgi:hypothetical protein